MYRFKGKETRVHELPTGNEVSNPEAAKVAHAAFKGAFDGLGAEYISDEQELSSHVAPVVSLEGYRAGRAERTPEED